MGISQYIKEIGRGPRGAKPLSREQAADLFGQVAQAPCALPVVDGEGRMRGAISKTTLLRVLDRDTPPIPPDLPPDLAPAAETEATDTPRSLA